MILRDAVHGLISFESEEDAIIRLLMDTPEVQRLRRIKQLGVTSYAFPGAEHNRFSHAIGAAHVMQRLIVRLRSIDNQLPFWQRVSSDHARDALAAAFLHDVGHGPLSHLFEDALPGAPHHEVWTERVLTDPTTGVYQVLASFDAAMPKRVAALVHGKHPLPYLAKAVSGLVDVDRADYLLRDAYFTGAAYGRFDLDWLLRSLCFSPTKHDEAPGLAIDGAKGLPAVESFILARMFMFQQIYLHKSTRAAEWMIRAALRRASELVASGSTLAVPSAMRAAAFGGNVELADYLSLDDDVLSTSMREWEESTDTVLANLTRRVRLRHLFKTLELFGDYATPDGSRAALGIVQDIAKARGFDPKHDVGLDVATDMPLSTRKDPLLVVFHKGPARPVEDVSFVLGRLAEQRLTRIRVVMTPELRDEVSAALPVSEG